MMKRSSSENSVMLDTGGLGLNFPTSYKSNGMYIGQSKTFDILRFVLVCTILLVHIPFDPAASPYRADAGTFDQVVILLRDGVGRVGVPMLTLISGYLSGGGRQPYAGLIKVRVRTLVVPFLIFNTPVVLAAMFMKTRGMGNFWPTALMTPAGLADALLAVRAFPANLPLYFVRDLFLCFVLVPAIVPLRRVGLPFALGGLALMYLGGVFAAVFINDVIPLTFAIGLLCRLRGSWPFDFRRIGGAAGILLLLVTTTTYAALLPILMTYPPIVPRAAKLILIGAGLVGVWNAAAALRQGRYASWLAAASRYSFIIFLTHQPVLLVLFAMAKHGNVPFPLFFGAAPVLAVAVAITIARFGEAHFPTVYAMATGNRQASKAAV